MKCLLKNQFATFARRTSLYKVNCKSYGLNPIIIVIVIIGLIIEMKVLLTTFKIQFRHESM